MQAVSVQVFMARFGEVLFSGFQGAPDYMAFHEHHGSRQATVSDRVSVE